MGLVVSFMLRFVVLFVCAILLSFLSSFFTNDSRPNYDVALPRTLLVNGRQQQMIHVGMQQQHARPSSCETNCTIHIEKKHALDIIKATTSSSSSCKPTYGVMPCTHSILGGLFLLAAYGYIIFRAARLLVQGSELLLLVLGTGLVGGLILPIFGVLPDSILVLVSGMGGSKDEAQKEVLIGIGLLGGSNVMLLTLLWGTCLILGRCDLSEDSSSAIDKKLTKKFDLFGTGVEIDKSTQVSAGIMCSSIIPLIVVQVPHMFHSTNADNIAILIACILSLATLVTYCTYQVMVPHHTKKRKLKALHDVIIFHLLKFSSVEGKLVYEDGSINEEVLKGMFDRLDTDHDNHLKSKEVEAMLTVNIFNKKLNDEVLDHFMKDFDTNQNDVISWREFLDGMKKWCKDMKPTHTYSIDGQNYIKMENLLIELHDIMEYEEKREILTRCHLITKSIVLILAGTVLVSVFAEPLVDAVDQFAQSSHIPSFFVSFVLLPLASNSSESISSILFSSRKKKTNMSLTYSQIYGAVTMNNTLSLGILLAIIYSRHLMWDFSSEVLIICLVTIVMGSIALIRRVLPFWIAILALLVYPLSIGLVAILDYIIGWN